MVHAFTPVTLLLFLCSFKNGVASKIIIKF
jgi:hypothetical protein